MCSRDDETPNAEDPIVGYLLGKLPAEDGERLEQRLLSEPEFFAQLLEAEEELIDRDVREDLSAEDRERFESHFLSTPERRQKVRFARALTRYAREQDWLEPSAGLRARGLWRFWLGVAAAVTLVLAGSLLAAYTRRLASELERVSRQQGALGAEGKELRRLLREQRGRNELMAEDFRREREERVRLQSELATLLRPGPAAAGRPPSRKERPQTLVAFALTPGVLRDSSEARTLAIPAGTELVRLELGLESEAFTRYRAVVRTLEGDEVWSRVLRKTQVAGSGAAVVLNVPTALFSNRNYLISLSGAVHETDFEDLSKYAFRVKRN